MDNGFLYFAHCNFLWTIRVLNKPGCFLRHGSSAREVGLPSQIIPGSGPAWVTSLFIQNLFVFFGGDLVSLWSNLTGGPGSSLLDFG